jgi:hypothetical protein
VVLCFGDEYPDQQRHRKMITAQVTPENLKAQTAWGLLATPAAFQK